MDLIHNGFVTSQNKDGHNSRWTFVKFVWRIMERYFLNAHLGQEKKYQALTQRYGYMIVKGMRKSDF